MGRAITTGMGRLARRTALITGREAWCWCDQIIISVEQRVGRRKDVAKTFLGEILCGRVISSTARPERLLGFALRLIPGSHLHPHSALFSEPIRLYRPLLIRLVREVNPKLPQDLWYKFSHLHERNVFPGAEAVSCSELVTVRTR